MRQIYWLLLSLFITLTQLLDPHIALSQWNPDPLINTPVCTTPGVSQYSPQFAPDGNGGVYIAWMETVEGSNSSQVFAQHVSAEGNRLWAAGGVPVTGGPGLYSTQQIVSDGNGGAMVSWVDVAGATIHHYMQRINAAGQRLWNTNGVAVCPTQTTSTYFYYLLTDGRGGAILVWDDQRGGSTEVYAQRLNGAGSLQWPAAGVAVAPAFTNIASYEAVPDSTGGMMLCYTLQLNVVNRTDVYVQHINGQGIAQWGSGINICSAPKDQLYCKMVKDTGHNVIVIWQDFRLDPNRSQIYGQRISPNGSLQWPADGALLVDSVVAASTVAKITTDTKKGIQILWQDKFIPGGNTTHLYALRVDSTATPLGVKKEIATWQDFNIPTDFKAVPDFNGGSFIAWGQPSALSGNPYEIYDVYAQHLLVNGNTAFPLAGQVMGAAAHSQLFQQLFADSSGLGVVAWSDLRNGADFDLYAAKLSAQAALPVSWISFEGRAVQQTVELKWVTTDEINNQGFYIQRSADGIHFTDIGFTAASNASTQTTYRFTDAHPLPGTNFYRLNQVDKDGKNEYSKTIRVNIAPVTAALQVYPNPVTSTLFLQGDIANATISVYSQAGRKMKEVRNGNSEVITLSVNELAGGQYFVRVVGLNDKVRTVGFVKR